MPRPRKNIKKDESVNATLIEMDPKALNGTILKSEMWRAEAREKMKDAVKHLSQMQRDQLHSFDFTFNSLIMGIPEKVLKTEVNINDKEFMEAFLRWTIEGNKHKEETQPNSELIPPRTTVRRRSKSVNTVKCRQRSKSQRDRLRSTSVDVYKTPKGRVRLSSIMSNAKYTVMKPKKCEKSGVLVKRVMKPNEEAISTCGSPLFVASCSLGGPHVNIPLPGGVVLNIEPTTPKGSLQVPNLDPKTRNQIKLLCEQLKKLC